MKRYFSLQRHLPTPERELSLNSLVKNVNAYTLHSFSRHAHCSKVLFFRDPVKTSRCQRTTPSSPHFVEAI